MKQVIIYLNSGQEINTTMSDDEVEVLKDKVASQDDVLETIALNDTTTAHINAAKIDALICTEIVELEE